MRDIRTPEGYKERCDELEEQGCTTSDAQGVVDAELHGINLRAGRAETALRAHYRGDLFDKEEPEELVQDLLTDLFHFLHTQKAFNVKDAEELTYLAWAHFENELSGGD